MLPIPHFLLYFSTHIQNRQGLQFSRGGWDDYVYDPEELDREIAHRKEEERKERERLDELCKIPTNDYLLQECFRRIREEAEEEMLRDLAKLGVSSSQVAR